MRLRSVLVVSSLVSAVACAGGRTVATAPSPADAPILAAIDSTLFALVGADTALMRRMLVPGATFAATPVDGAVPSGIVNDRQVLAQLVRDATPLLERYWSPRIERHGRLAIVTAPYDFWTNRRFSHCGVDVFTLLETNGRWRVAAIAYTIQEQGCPASPLGAPRF